MTEPSKKRRRVAGGAATGGGINFQAAVSAIACVYMARGQQLSWLEKVAEDVPVAVYAETGGAGDDIRLLLKSGKIIEAQVKKGLRSGRKLWDALTGLASAIKAGTINYGVLIVSPTSSNTITEELAKDIVRLGGGRSDNLSQIATQLIVKLKALDLPIVESCKRIRIQTINALAGNQADILATRSELVHLCADQKQVLAAWNVLHKDALDLIEHRGRRDVSSVMRLLSSEGVMLAEKNSTAPMLLLGKLTNWTFATHANFSIFGVNKALRIDKAWIPLRAVVQNETQAKIESLSDALKNYQSWEGRSVHQNAVIVNPETLARFITRTILIGGPGMGKTTLLKRIARRYSEDHIPILHVRLIAVVSRMRAGSSFEEAVFDLGLDGSGIASPAARQAAFPNWLLLCDGLDECGKLQEEVAAGIARFAAGHPDCRVLVTTRPVGYDTSHFSDWRHYYLAPLEPSSAPTHLTTLVSESALEGSPFQDNTYALCAAELEKKETSKVVSRSPLILGLAASIIVNGGHLGATKERLFEQIFELIDEVPNSRIPEPPAPSALLRRFLDILGWHITAHPLSRIDDTLNRCAEELARETGSKRLRARVDAEACLRYWQDVGMIEKIGHGCEETLVFIHKSFGEFAAARHLSSMTSSEQYAAIINIVNDHEWVEVIRFAALLGLSNIIGNILISSDSPGSEETKRIALAIELVAAATPPPERTLRERIINEAFKIVSSMRRLQAIEVGEPLVAAARRYPEEVGPLVTKLLNHKQSWTYLIGWATAVAAGPDYYRLDNLADSMRICIDSVGPNIRSSLGGGIILDRSVEQDLLQTFTLDAASVLLEQGPTDLTDSIVLDALNKPNLNTMGFFYKAQKLLRSKGRIEAAGKLDNKYNFPPLMLDIEGYKKALFIAYESIFEALDLTSTIVENDRNPSVLLYLSAFLEASKFGDIPVSDIWAWTLPFDKAATRETLKGFIGISKIDTEMLRSDAHQARSYLCASGANNIFEITTHVDPPAIDWTIAPTLDLDTTKIEAALYHPSQWIVWLAANLIENLLPQPELKLTVRRLFERGRGYTLWAASGLAAELDQDQAVELLFERLSAPLIRGCEYLFRLLQQFELQWGPELSDILRGGLRGDVDIAKEAAKLALNIAKRGQADLAAILEDAFVYWVEHEEPYPTKDGVIPHSPRAELLAALTKIRPLSYIELKSHATDPRSDVKDIATGQIMKLLQLFDGPRVQFLNDISSEILPSNLLSKALESMAPLNSEELTLWEGLLVSKNPKIRFGAMSLLHKDHLDPIRLRANAQAMTGDNEQQIRDRAYRILDML
ncbi:MAG: NACHT domain-containing protein [Smithella sp.]